MTAPAYRVIELCFRHGHIRSAERDWVLEGLDFSVSEREFLGIIGPNGSGKTSLLNVLARLTTPQMGSVELFGDSLADLRQDAIARTVALVPQETSFTFPFSVLETVLMGRYPHHRAKNSFASLAGMGWESQRDVDVAWSAMHATSVANVAQRPINSLSGGERQRVLIARALAQEPRIVLLDEPTAHLDLHHQLETCRLLRQLNDERAMTVILVSHDLNLASQFCDRLLLLSHGRLAAVGRPHEVLRADTLRAVYGCDVLIDQHPASGLPRITMPGRTSVPRSSLSTM